jgi:hypothetical protein
VLVLHERHQVHVALALDDEDTLAGVTAGVRVFQNVEQITALDVEDDVLEPDAALRPELRVLRVVPVEVLHRYLGYHDVCLIGTHWRRLQCARQCAQPGPKTINRQPTPTKPPMKNGPEIIDFRPVL